MSQQKRSRTSRHTPSADCVRPRPVAPKRRAAGVPRYLTAQPRPRRQDAEREADVAASDWRTRGSARITPMSGPSSPRAAEVSAQAAGGRPLSPAVQARAEQRYGIDASAVRVHDDPQANRMARGFGANAMTVGNDIFFGYQRYAPETPDGERVLAHELAHVAQQGGAPRAVQCDLAMSLPVSLGVFDMNMITQAGGGAGGGLPGMAGTIKFDPDPQGPYSSEIGLVQAINITDVGGTTTPSSGAPMDWGRIRDVNTGVAGTEAGRMEMMTTGTDGAPAGWYIDSLPSATPRGDRIGPNYIEHFNSPEPDNQFGYLRSPTDHRPASLWDFPQMSFDVDFDFETAARGTDNQTIYGSLFWGFHIRSGVVGGEYAAAQDGVSATFDEALERFRGYYVHEPVVLYFDTHQEIPAAGEETKLTDIPDYLDRYPDVMVQIEGFADLRGSEAGNADLAQRRADAAQTLLMGLGIDASRVDFSVGWGETTEFSELGSPSQRRQRSEPGLWQANRRVVISFSHTVSNHPIVMP